MDNYHVLVHLKEHLISFMMSLVIVMSRATIDKNLPKQLYTSVLVTSWNTCESFYGTTTMKLTQRTPWQSRLMPDLHTTRILRTCINSEITPRHLSFIQHFQISEVCVLLWFINIISQMCHQGLAFCSTINIDWTKILNRDMNHCLVCAQLWGNIELDGSDNTSWTIHDGCT